MLGENCCYWPHVMIVGNMLRAGLFGEPAPIDVYDAAAWSSIMPLSATSIAAGSRAVDVPDFTGGRWKTRKA
jgi:hypothetical protein